MSRQEIFQAGVEAVEVARRVVVMTPTEDDDYREHLSQSALSLLLLHQRNGSVDALREAATLAEQAVGLCGPGDPDRAARLSLERDSRADPARANRRHRHRSQGRRNDQRSGRGGTGDQPHRPGRAPDQFSDWPCAGFMSALAIWTWCEKRLIATGRRLPPFLPVTPIGLSCRPISAEACTGRTRPPGTRLCWKKRWSLAVLASACRRVIRSWQWRRQTWRSSCLTRLHERTGHLESLTEAMALARAAVDGTPADHRDYSTRTLSLALGLLALFQRTGDEQVGIEAIATARAALAAIPAGSPLRALLQSDLGLALRSRYEVTGDLEILREAIAADTGAMAAGAADPALPRYQSNLGLAITEAL